MMLRKGRRKRKRKRELRMQEKGIEVLREGERDVVREGGRIR